MRTALAVEQKRLEQNIHATCGGTARHCVLPHAALPSSRTLPGPGHVGRARGKVCVCMHPWFGDTAAAHCDGSRQTI